MAEKRKLLAEIEKCYKKIDEGVELFEEIMDKMHEANSDNQRDKYQDDLKKEIKKLQRLRDQVKNWQNSSDIKDKEKLCQYRKLIEQRMEQFKDVERENKTKPHSKLGLSAEEKLDPREKEKAEVIDWIQVQIRPLNDEADRSEMQLESLLNSDTGKGKRGKKEDAKTKAERERKADELRKHLERLKFHIDKLEVCQRMISNESLNAKHVMMTLKEPIESYVEIMESQGEDKDVYYDPDDAYDELNLEKLCAQIGGVNLLSTDDDHNGHDLGIDVESGQVSSSRHGSGENGQPASPAGRRVPAASTIIGLPSPSASSSEQKKMASKESSLDRPKSPSSLVSSAPPPPPPVGIPYNSVAAGRSTTTPVPSTPIAPSMSGIPSTPATASTISTNSATPNTNIVGTPTFSEALTSSADRGVINNDTSREEKAVEEKIASIAKIGSVTSKASVDEEATEQQKHLNGEATKTSTAPSAAGTLMADDSALRALRLSNQIAKTDETSDEPKRAHIPAWLGASPLGRAPNTQEYDVQLAALELAVTKTQLPLDSERPRNYLPKMIFPVPAYYAQSAPATSDSLEYYLRLSPDTLFFIFYYMEGTKAQLLAAKALKKLSWRFHTKYLTWFQRHEEPKQITDDFEQGTYVYFDFEKWSQRKKESFTFEYKFLEDKEYE